VLGYREKEQKKSKNKFDQEETTDAWGFEKPSTSGISQTLKKGQKKSKNKSQLSSKVLVSCAWVS
jgi:hypothetical protein